MARNRQLSISLMLVLGATVGAAETADVQAQLDELRQAQAALAARIADLARHEPHHDAHGDEDSKHLDVSLAVEAIAGWSSESDASIANLEGGSHDPQQRGFTMPSAELTIAGAVDPHFMAQANVVFLIDSDGQSVVELEEAFIRTRSLPYGLEITAGQFFTAFGRFNATHPHAWSWIDQPVINSRLFGGDGMRSQGASAGAVLPTAWWSEVMFAVQNARGETMASFFAEGEGLGGRDYGLETTTRSAGDLAWSSRWSNASAIGAGVGLRFGASLAVGPNASGSDTDSLVYGAHLTLSWDPQGDGRGFPRVTWETEAISRQAEVDVFVADPGGPDETIYDADTLGDRGLFSQLLVGFRPGWSAGLRYEAATGSGDSVGGRASDPLRDDRMRLSPLIAWRPTPASRLRLQYNYDRADHLADGDAHSAWLALDIILGAHPTHGL